MTRMPKAPKRILLLAAVWSLAITSVVLASETYIVPIYGHGIGGVGALWDSTVLVSNPHDISVTVRVADVFSAFSNNCPQCREHTSLVVPPHSTRAIPE